MQHYISIPTTKEDENWLINSFDQIGWPDYLLKYEYEMNKIHQVKAGIYVSKRHQKETQKQRAYPKWKYVKNHCIFQMYIPTEYMIV